ncbi:unnamed protein product, partial [Rotaria magnacalcarata]
DIVETTVDASSSFAGSRRVRSRFTSADTDNIVPSITANDSLNLGVSNSLDSQQQQQQQPRRRTNRVHNQRKNTGRIIWNDETKEVEIRDDSNDLVPKTSYQQTSIEESHRSDDQKLQDNAQQSTSNSVALGSRGLISRFENIPPLSSSISTTKESLTNLSPTSPSSSSSTSRTSRSQSQDPSRKSLSATTSLPPPPTPSSSSTSSSTATATTITTPTNPNTAMNDSKENTALSTGISATNNDTLAIKRLYEDAKRKVDELAQKVDRLERDIAERDQMIEKLKTSQYIESSLDKREKRAYERKISELEEELKKMDSIKADNTRLKEENAALIRVISKLSK